MSKETEHAVFQKYNVYNHEDKENEMPGWANSPSKRSDTSSKRSVSESTKARSKEVEIQLERMKKQREEEIIGLLQDKIERGSRSSKASSHHSR